MYIENFIQRRGSGASVQTLESDITVQSFKITEPGRHDGISGNLPFSLILKGLINRGKFGGFIS